MQTLGTMEAQRATKGAEQALDDGASVLAGALALYAIANLLPDLISVVEGIGDELGRIRQRDYTP